MIYYNFNYIQMENNKIEKDSKESAVTKKSTFYYYLDRLTHFMRNTDDYSIETKVKSFQDRVLHRNFSFDKIEEFEYFYKCEQEDVERDIKRYTRKCAFIEYFPGLAVVLLLLTFWLYYIDQRILSFISFVPLLYLVFYRVFKYKIDRDAITICIGYKKYLKGLENRNENCGKILKTLTTHEAVYVIPLFDLRGITQSEFLAFLVALERNHLLKYNENLKVKNIILQLADSLTLDGAVINKKSFYNTFIRYEKDNIAIDKALKSIKSKIANL